MSRTVAVRYQTRPDAGEENERLVQEVFAQLSEEDPGSLRYLTFRLADGVTFVHLAVVEGEANPLPELAAFQAFQRHLGVRVVSAPVLADATLVGCYGFVCRDV